MVVVVAVHEEGPFVAEVLGEDGPPTVYEPELLVKPCFFDVPSLVLVALAQVGNTFSNLAFSTSKLKWIFSEIILLIEFFEVHHLAVSPACERAAKKWYLVVELIVLDVRVNVHEICLLLWTKVFIYLEPDLFSPFLVQDRIHLIAHSFTPEDDTVRLTFTNVAIIFVVNLTRHGIFRALVPLATPRDVRLMPKHTLEDELLIDRKLNWILLVHLRKL